MAQYLRKPEVFEVMKYTGDNAEAVSAWLSDSGKFGDFMDSDTGEWIHGPDAQPPIGVSAGQYIVISHTHGQFVEVVDSIERYYEFV